MRKTLLVLIILFLLLSCSCQGKNDQSSLVVASWNVQNLFDAIDDPTDYSEYTSIEGWNQEGYERRLDKALSVVNRIEGLSILVLQEVEGPRVVQDLISRNLGRKDLVYYAVAHEPSQAISTAIISSIPFLDVKIHGVKNQRSIIEASFIAQGQVIGVFAVHFKSRVEGEEQTDALRLESMKALKACVKDFQIQNPQSLVLLCGDFNTCPRIETENQGLFVRPGSLMAEDYEKEGSLVISSQGNSVMGAWYCPWLDNESLKGSYFYQGNWLCYDNVFVNSLAFDKSGWEMTGFDVLDDSFLLNEEQCPYAWRLYTRSGISDHLPVYMSLNYGI